MKKLILVSLLFVISCDDMASDIAANSTNDDSGVNGAQESPSGYGKIVYPNKHPWLVIKNTQKPFKVYGVDASVPDVDASVPDVDASVPDVDANVSGVDISVPDVIGYDPNYQPPIDTFDHPYNPNPDPTDDGGGYVDPYPTNDGGSINPDSTSDGGSIDPDSTSDGGSSTDDGDLVDGSDLDKYCTYTQGGWGSSKNSEPGSYRDEYFTQVFPDGLTIGCEEGYTILLLNSKAIEMFLPQGGGPGILNSSCINPTETSAGVFAGQIVALTLSVMFDQYDLNFCPSSSLLSDFVLIDSDCDGLTVGELLNISNEVIGGCNDQWSFELLNECISFVNEKYAK